MVHIEIEIKIIIIIILFLYFLYQLYGLLLNRPGSQLDHVRNNSYII
jgi:hypothetical protein